jgi:D-xylose transport system substrate-binding protein
MASGAIAALKGAGVKPIPPVTGLDAELAAVQRILRGEQYMTVYLDVEEEARTGAAMAAALAKGEEMPQDLITGSLNNGFKDVPGALLETTPVTIDEIQSELIDSGYLDAAEVCTADLKAACADAGIG